MGKGIQENIVIRVLQAVCRAWHRLWKRHHQRAPGSATGVKLSDVIFAHYGLWGWTARCWISHNLAACGTILWRVLVQQALPVPGT